MNYKNYIFIDRDDTLIVDKEYLSDPAGVEFPKGAIDGLKRLRDAGYGIILITNQSGIGRGYFTENDLTAVHNRLKELLAAEVAGVFDALPRLLGESVLTMPLPAFICAVPLFGRLHGLVHVSAERLRIFCDPFIRVVCEVLPPEDELEIADVVVVRV